MFEIMVIKDIDYDNPLFDKIPYPKLFVDDSPESIISSLSGKKKIVITWNSTTILDLSLIERMYNRNFEISFIANIPEYMEFEVWDSEFLVEVLEKYKKTSKPLRNILSPIELDEAVYYTDVVDEDVRLYRWELTPYSFRAREIVRKILGKIDINQNVLAQIKEIFRNNPYYLVEVPTFYYIELSSKKVETKYLPIWGTNLGDISADQYSELISKIYDYSKTFGVMLGVFNEPLFNTEIGSILEHTLRYKGKEVSFIFNTSLPVLSEELINVFKETKGIIGYKGYPFFSIFVDIPSNEKQHYEYLKNLNFEETIQNLRRLLDIDKERVFIRFFRTKLNDSVIPSFYNEFKEYNIIIQRPQLSELISVDTILPTRLPCYKLQNSTLILPTGDVYLCVNDVNLSNFIGNVFKESFRDIFLKKSDILKQHFEGRFYGICEKCPIWDQFDL